MNKEGIKQRTHDQLIFKIIIFQWHVVEPWLTAGEHSKHVLIIMGPMFVLTSDNRQNRPYLSNNITKWVLAFPNNKRT